MQKITVLTFFCLFFSCNEPAKKNSFDDIDPLAERYVRLALQIGQYDADFVDAYYGPDSLKPILPKLAAFPKDSFLLSVKDLKKQFEEIASSTKNDTIKTRASWISGQLTAFDRRIRIFSGQLDSFDVESKALFGVVAPTYKEDFFLAQLAQLDSFLPGKGSVAGRFQQLANRFIIPKKKLDTVFKVAIAEARRRTLQHFELPATEDFKLEYVTNKPWSGYNWYKGNYQSLIQINTDLNIFIDRAIDVGSHESYPGHHVYNMLLEKKLYREKGWVEISLYPLFSPQSLIAEGSANYGIDVVFPGIDKEQFTRDILLPLAGLDTTGIGLYYKATALKGKLNFARNEVARGIVNGTMDEKEVMRWLTTYCLYNNETAVKSISFIKKNRSYVINYNYGQELVKNYIESKGGTEANSKKRWELFEWLLSNPVTTGELLKFE